MQGTEIAPYCYLAGLFLTHMVEEVRGEAQIWALSRKMFLRSVNLGLLQGGSDCGLNLRACLS